jgi:acetylornithine deacetylase/succinyl-diaminopimelate desuccinylase-like protein
VTSRRENLATSEPPNTPAASRWYARKGIPAFAHGPGFLEVAHGPNEVVEIERAYQHPLVHALTAARLLA